ncbi:lytic transglycosylase domain-containing protein [Cognatishimia maritima]|uniref:Transglycosylase SLT domain-containing protein n=1 Tax=Cognatishimia maritima TaxID=870908 RepID=A0A1M5VRZ1_9RHOB|nr:lytic transglycosylase domain-containing protein [Cognatishimia maritima]SHH78026.1 Transglycosylase SLT domain-containing protein [Cognatishimia maritima]
MARGWGKALGMIVAGLLAPALALGPAAVQADLFTNLYASAAPVPAPVVQVPAKNRPTTGARCVAAILEAQQKYGIPDNLLLSIGIQEAGRNGPAGLAVWPWTVNANGEGAFFKSRLDAQNWVREKQAQGITSIDVGCMQINLRWHGDQFPSQEAAFDPEMNADYAARFLLGLYQETGSWQKAAGRYHSATDVHQARYLASLERNRKVVERDIDRLTALARSYAPVAVAEVVAPRDPPPPVFWGVSDGSSYSIYSNTEIRPMLPDYKELF